MVVIRAINLFFEIVFLLVLARCAGSFFIRPGDSIYRFYLSICSLTEPILAPCRKLLSRIGFGGGMIDFSPVLAMLILGVVQRFLTSVLVRLMF